MAGDNRQRGIVGGTQSDDPHDGFPVYPIGVFLEEDLRCELIGGLHDESRGTSVNSRTVFDGDDS